MVPFSLFTYGSLKKFCCPILQNIDFGIELGNIQNSGEIILGRNWNQKKQKIFSIKMQLPGVSEQF